MVTINPLRTRLTLLFAILTLATFCVPVACAQKPKIAVSVSGVPSEVKQLELLTGAVTITLSGFKNPVDITAGSAVYARDSGGRKMIVRGQSVSLKQRGNGVLKLSLSGDMPVRSASDEGPYELEVYAYIPSSKPIIKAQTVRVFQTTSDIADITLIETTKNHLSVASTENPKQHQIIVQYIAINHTRHPVDITLNQQVAVSGPYDYTFTQDVIKQHIEAGREQLISRTYTGSMDKPGIYTISCKVKCDKAKRLLLRIQYERLKSSKARSLRIKNVSVDSSTGEIGKPIRLRLRYELTNALPNLWPKVTENVVISGPENLSGSAIRYLDDETNEGEGIYESKLSKPGSYSWKVSLSSIFSDTKDPVVATGTFTVTRKAGSASKTVWVSSGGVDSGERSALQISAGSVVYNDAIGPERKIYTNRMSWTEPPLTVNEGDTLEFKTSCTQNEHAYLAGKFSMSGFGGEIYQSFISMVTCTNPKDGRDSYNMSLKFIPKDTQKPYIEWCVGESPYTNSYLMRRWTYEKREVTPEAGDLPKGTLYDVTPVKPAGPKPKSNESGNDKTKGTVPAVKVPTVTKPPSPKSSEKESSIATDHSLFNTILPGAVVAMKEGRWIISSFDDPFMAADFGIAIGDEIVRINGKPVHGISDSQMEEMAKTEPGQSIRIEFKHPNGQIVSVVMVR
ncbi:MAG: hypothetical protein ACYC1M_03860 [Armatimonadota bacterium]